CARNHPGTDYYAMDYW
nr:immunoglobulin heavy chain junction region [Mus musculus]